MRNKAPKKIVVYITGPRKRGANGKEDNAAEIPFRCTSMRLRSHSDLLSEHMRKCVIPFIHRSLVHLEQATVSTTTTPRRRSGRSGGGGRRRRGLGATTLGGLAALPANPAALEDLLATIEQHVELSIADDAALARGRALHDFDVLALELEKLGGHLRDRLPRFTRLGAAADWHLELAWWGGDYVSARPAKSGEDE